MSFVAGRTYVVNGAVGQQYRIQHPIAADGNFNAIERQYGLYPHIEVANMTGGLVFIAMDRPVVVPSGNGVQGSFISANYPQTDVAPTRGDFDFCISTANGWGALDITLKQVSQYMSVYFVAAGAVTVSYGDQM